MQRRMKRAKERKKRGERIVKHYTGEDGINSAVEGIEEGNEEDGDKK